MKILRFSKLKQNWNIENIESKNKDTFRSMQQKSRESTITCMYLILRQIKLSSEFFQKPKTTNIQEHIVLKVKCLIKNSKLNNASFLIWHKRVTGPFVIWIVL